MTKVRTKIRSRCLVCGRVYRERIDWLDESLVNAGLTESHGYCPECIEKEGSGSGGFSDAT